MGKRQLRLQWVAMLLALGLIGLGIGCETTEEGTDGGIDTDGSVPPADSSPPPPGIVTYKNAGETAEADFSTGSESYLVVPYSVSNVAADFIEFEIKLTTGAGPDGSVGSSTKSLRVKRPLPLKVRNPALWARWQQRLAVERWSRGLAEQAARSGKLVAKTPMSRPLASCTTSSECGATEVCAEGTCASTVTVKVEEFATTSGTQTIDAEVKKKGDKAAILVDTSDTIAQADLDAVLDTFENVTFPRDTGLFGHPDLEDGSKKASDRNGDGLVWLVLTSKVAEKNAVGFFVATDFSDPAQEPKSNGADILYIDPDQDVKKIHTTMAHEFQHLLSFAAKVYKPQQAGNQGALEELWLDEGMSHFAEDACGFPGDNVVVLDQEVFTSFSETRMFEASVDGLAMRGMAFLYVRYLFEQKGGVTYNSDGTITDAGGAAMLQAIHGTTKQGTDAIDEAYGDHKAGFDGWITAVALDGRGVTDFSQYVYDDLVEDPVGGKKLGVKIRGDREDDTGTVVTLQGPLEEDLTADTTGEIPNATGKFFKLANQSGTVGVQVSSQDADFRFALIKLQ